MTNRELLDELIHMANCGAPTGLCNFAVKQFDENAEMRARLELLNGTAATKLEKHNTEMEQYKKQVIELRNEGKSWAMIAEITGINVSTVRSWVRNSK